MQRQAFSHDVCQPDQLQVEIVQFFDVFSATKYICPPEPRRDQNWRAAQAIDISQGSECGDASEVWWEV